MGVQLLAVPAILAGMKVGWDQNKQQLEYMEAKTQELKGKTKQDEIRQEAQQNVLSHIMKNFEKNTGLKPPSTQYDPRQDQIQQQGFQQPPGQVPFSRASGGPLAFTQNTSQPTGRMDIALPPDATDQQIAEAYRTVQAAPQQPRGLPGELAQAQTQAEFPTDLPDENPYNDPNMQVAWQLLFGKNLPPGAQSEVHYRDYDQGTNYLAIPIDKRGRRVGQPVIIPKSPKYDFRAIQTPEGGEAVRPVDPYNPGGRGPAPGAGGAGPAPGLQPGDIQTKPSPLDMKGVPPKEEEQKLFNLKTQMGELWELGGMAAERPDIVGLAGEMQFGLAENKFSAWFLSKFGHAPDPAVIDFYKRLNRLQSVVVHEFGGSALSAQELKRALAMLPKASTAKEFIQGLRAVDASYKKYEQDFYEFYSKSPRERATIEKQNKKPSLKMGKTPEAGGQPPKTAEEYLKMKGM